MTGRSQNAWRTLRSQFEEGGLRFEEAAAHLIISDIRDRSEMPWSITPSHSMLALYHDALDLAAGLMDSGEETWTKALDLAVALKYRSIVTGATKPDVRSGGSTLRPSCPECGAHPQEGQDHASWCKSVPIPG